MGRYPCLVIADNVYPVVITVLVLPVIHAVVIAGPSCTAGDTYAVVIAVLVLLVIQGVLTEQVGS